jgi:membrane AbrB-like protein
MRQKELQTILFRSASFIGIYLAAATAGWGFAEIGLPLPWMLGPLILSGALYASGLARIKIPVRTRPFGQMTVAAQVGLTFTPAAFASLLELTPLIVGLAAVSGVMASLVAIMLARATGMRISQAFVSTFPTSPVEAAVIAERLGIALAPVVVAQTVRVALIVLLVPMTIYIVEGIPDRAAGGAVIPFDLPGNLLLAAIAIGGAFAFRMLRLSNPFFLGPLAVCAMLTAFGMELPPFPPLVMALAQIALGTWLGSTFRRELFASGDGQIIGATVSALVLLSLISAVALGLAHLCGYPWIVLVLGAAPGGVTEMALTAKFLGVEVALVTAIQLTRIFLFMPNIPWIVRLIDQAEARRRP